MASPHATAKHRGPEFITNALFHLIYGLRKKWFRGRLELFRRRCSEETICRAESE